MNCRKFQERIEDYLQGGLDFAGRFAIERHAQQCIDCGKEMADAQKLSQMIRQLNRVKAPEDFESALLKRIGEQHIKRQRQRFWLGWAFRFEMFSWRNAAAVAGGLLVFSVGLSLWQYLANRDRNPGSPAVIAEAQKGNIGVRGNARKPMETNPGVPPGTVVPEASDGTTPMEISSRRRQSGFSSEGESPHIFAEPASSDYVEYLVPVSGDRHMIMRLPKTIRMQYAPPSDEYFIRNVSH
jgi:hypothetical protein